MYLKIREIEDTEYLGNEIIVENIPSLAKDMGIQIQETQEPQPDSTKYDFFEALYVKLSKVKDKRERDLKLHVKENPLHKQQISQATKVWDDNPGSWKKITYD